MTPPDRQPATVPAGTPERSVPLSRRAFSGWLLGSATPLVTLATSPTVSAAEAQVAPRSEATVIERQLELILQQYPDPRLDAAAVAEIRDDLETQRLRSDLLNRFPLPNHAEPGPIFTAWRRAP
ncbi:MAG: hypothetical protein JSS02_17185 [Planctomycetes bacterium]|nr:hypothetical protein [Planctomycetota bacterium]